MADVRALMSDPEFTGLDVATQKALLGRIDPDFANLSDADYSQVRQKLSPAVVSQQSHDTAGPWASGYVPALTHAPTGPILGGPVLPMEGIIPTAAAAGISKLEQWMKPNPTKTVKGYPQELNGTTPLGAPMLASPNSIRDIEAAAPRAGAGLAGAAKGAYSGATEMVPAAHGLLPRLLGMDEMPAVLSGGITGATAGKVLGGNDGAIGGGLLGAAVPVIRGAVKGARAGMADFDSAQKPRGLLSVEPATPVDAPATPVVEMPAKGLLGDAAIVEPQKHYADYGLNAANKGMEQAKAKDASLIGHFEAKGFTPDMFAAATEAERNVMLSDANKTLGKKYGAYRGANGEASANRLLETWRTPAKKGLLY